jgi:hypothetical protein
MTTMRAAVYLFTPFFAALVIHLFVILLVFQKAAIYPEDVSSLMPKILAIYSVHFAVILGGIFGRKQSRAKKNIDAVFWIALSLVIVWNLLLVWRSVTFGLAGFGIGQDATDSYISYLTTVSSSSTFLIVGGLAYFFSK